MKQNEEGTARERIINLLKSSKEHWFTPREIKEITGVAGVTFRMIISDLYHEEYIVKKDSSRYTRYKWDGYL